jgi:hypothetical protein
MKWVSLDRLRWLAIPLVGAFAFSPRGYAQSSLPVVPGAAGYGMNTRAAYACGSSPTIHRVTNLNDSGSGSLREALTASGPRVVVFEISGYINVSSNIWVTSPCVTVAGQTAPSPGITVRMVPGGGSTEAMFLINTHDVLFQHFRIRPGWGSDLSDSICNSGIQMYGGGEYNVVMDHMSLSWAQDENFMFGYGTSQNGGLTNATIWRSIIAEGLAWAPGSSGCSGGGQSGGHGIGAGPAKRVAVMQTLIAKNRERNPYFTATWGLLANNVIYDWNGPWGYFLANNDGSGPWYITAIGNRFIVGPNTASADIGGGAGGAYAFYYYTGLGTDSRNQIYQSDNSVDQAAFSAITVIKEQSGLGYDPKVGAPPANAPLPDNFSAIPSSSIESFVLANAGARPLDRDAVDQRIVGEVQARSGSIPRSPGDVGGYPALPVNRRALTLPSSPHSTTSSGYTNLEKWLHNYAAALETGAEISAPQGPPPPTGVRIVS